MQTRPLHPKLVLVVSFIIIGVVNTILAEIQNHAEASREREPFEWEDLLHDQVQGLTSSQRVGPGEQYKVLAAPDYRDRLIRIAALAIAAIEVLDHPLITVTAVTGPEPEKPF